jgi:hypothetical protein
MQPLPKSSESTPEGYEALPEGIKDSFTPHEYAWMSDARKASLVRDETEPDA